MLIRKKKEAHLTTPSTSLKPIEKEADWLISTIEEHFDDALSMLEDDCVIYGGVIRDVMANLPLLGDLDIIIPSYLKTSTINNFIGSARWTEMRGKNKKYLTSSRNIIQSVHTFVNMNDREVQLIIPTDTVSFSVSSTTCSEFYKPIVDVASEVDMICCGLLSDLLGNIYEVLPGAVRDCKTRTLNINKNIKFDADSVGKLNTRIAKFIKRGWTNNIQEKDLKE